MRTMMPVLLIAVVVIILIQLLLRRKNAPRRGFQKMQEELERENTLYTRQHPVEESLFFVPDTSLLPVQPYNGDELAEKKTAAHQQKVLEQCGTKMLKFDTPMTNRELKERFGTAQLEKIAMYEENYVKLMHQLTAWADSLRRDGQDTHAAQALEAGIAYGSDMSRMYTMLAEIYKARREKDALERLGLSAEHLAEPIRGKVKRQIEQYLSEL